MELRYDERGLIPAIVQDAATGEVLILAYMNEESLRRTLESRQVWFYSRSRQELWHKGSTSGNVLELHEIRQDCDDDALLLKVTPAGPACHTGERSCFFPAPGARTFLGTRRGRVGFFLHGHRLFQGVQRHLHLGVVGLPRRQGL